MKQIWSLNIPPKVKHFLWRLRQNILPTRQRLQSKGVNCEQTCYYNMGLENDFHFFFRCHHAKAVWEEVDMWRKFEDKIYQANTCFDLVFNLLDILPKADKENLTLTFWCIWQRRNKKIQKNVDPPPCISISLTREFFNEWRFTCKNSTAMTNSHCQSVHIQKKPCIDFIKCNIDATMFKELNNFGIGFCLRDEHGNFIKAKTFSL